MSVPNKVGLSPYSNQDVVYFYPKLLKISHASLQTLEKYLLEIFKADISQQESFRRAEKLIKGTLKELYRGETLVEDDTMVIFDKVVNETIFEKALEKSFLTLSKLKTKHKNVNTFYRVKRRIFNSIYLKKDNAFTDFFRLIAYHKSFYSPILQENVELTKLTSIKFTSKDLLEKYIVNIITRKALLAQGGSVYELILFTPVIIDLIAWYAKALSLRENSDDVSDDILSAAITLVDRHYITDPTFIKQLQNIHLARVVKLLSY